MSDVIAWIVAGAAALVALLFGGAWLHERKAKQGVVNDAQNLGRLFLREKLANAELKTRVRLETEIRKQSREGIEEMASNARRTTPAADFAERIRGGKGPEE